MNSRRLWISLALLATVVLVFLDRVPRSEVYEICGSCGTTRTSNTVLGVSVDERLEETAMSKWMLAHAGDVHSHFWVHRSTSGTGWTTASIACSMPEAPTQLRELWRAHQRIGDDPTLDALVRDFVNAPESDPRRRSEIVLLASRLGREGRDETASCASTNASYSAPHVSVERDAWTRTIDRPFDDVWSALVDHASGAFFGIENFEKESGLLTLSFGASNIEQFVDGGHWNYKQTSGLDPITGNKIGIDLEFEGNYVTFLERYRNGTLKGRMNIVVRALEDTRTEVKVRARYVVSTRATSVGTAGSDLWSFDTGGSDSVFIAQSADKKESMRTLCPTHVAERSIIDAIDAFGDDRSASTDVWTGAGY